MSCLTDGVVQLEPLSENHVAALAELGSDPEVQRFTYVPSPWVLGFERTWLESYERGRADGTREGFAIVAAADGAFLGIAVLVKLDRDGRQTEAGYIVAPAARGRGVAVRALGLLTDWALTELALERVELRIATENAASLRVAERCGFVREGVLRSVHLKDERRNDLAVFSRLASDESGRPASS